MIYHEKSSFAIIFYKDLPFNKYYIPSQAFYKNESKRVLEIFLNQTVKKNISLFKFTFKPENLNLILQK